jgi:molybdopterin synthase catalytic subunit
MINQFNELSVAANFSAKNVSFEGNSLQNYIFITTEKKDLNEAFEMVKSNSCGGISTFSGTTRDVFEGKVVLSLWYESYKIMAEKSLEKICMITRSKWKDIHKIFIYHRIGNVPVGETSVIIAVSSTHRKSCIESVHFIIDELKRKAEIWKKEIYQDGGSSWKQNCECGK